MTIPKDKIQNAIDLLNMLFHDETINCMNTINFLEIIRTKENTHAINVLDHALTLRGVIMSPKVSSCFYAIRGSLEEMLKQGDDPNLEEAVKKIDWSGLRLEDGTTKKCSTCGNEHLIGTMCHVCFGSK